MIARSEKWVKNQARRKIEAILTKYKDRIYYFWPPASMYGRSGIMDLTICCSGVFMGVETKRPGKGAKISKLQLRERDKLVASGGIHMFVDNESSLLQFEATLLRLIKHGEFIQKQVIDNKGPTCSFCRPCNLL